MKVLKIELFISLSLYILQLFSPPPLQLPKPKLPLLKKWLALEIMNPSKKVISPKKVIPPRNMTPPKK